ncbi:MAG: hypothetical protein ACOY4K_01070 [Pseudomonadota bacterium]
MRHLTFAEFCAELDAWLAAPANDPEVAADERAPVDEAAVWIETLSLAA